MNNKINLVAFLTIGLFTTTSSAVNYTVSQDGNGDYQTIQEAVTAIAALPDTASKFSTAGQTACFFGVGGGLENYVFGQGDMTWVDDVQSGDLIALDESDTWYEIEHVNNDVGLKIVRPDEGAAFRCGTYSIVEMNSIFIQPGNYTESIDLTDVHFVNFIGVGTKEDVVISNFDVSYSLPAMGYGGVDIPFDNTEIFGSISFENLTINSLYGGSVIGGTTILSGDPQPVNMNIHIKNVSMSSICCDLMFQDYGHVVIEDVYATAGADVFGGDLKSLTILNSTIISQWVPNLDMANPILFGVETKGLHVRVKYDSLIDNTTISSFHPGINSLGATAVRIFDTAGAIFTISNSKITAIGNQGEAIDLGATGTGLSGAVILHLENTYVNGTGNSSVVDIAVGADDVVNLTCTVIDTSIVLAGGLINDAGCN